MVIPIHFNTAAGENTVVYH